MALELIGMHHLLNRLRKIFDHIDPPETLKHGKALTSSQLRRSNISVEDAQDAVLWVNSGGKICYANQSACNVMGRSRDEMLGLSVMDVCSDFTVGRWSNLWDVVSAHQKVMLESHLTNKSGRLFTAEIAAHYMSVDDEEYSYLVVRELTEEKWIENDQGTSRRLVESLVSERTQALESELTVSNERLRLAIEASQAGIWDWNIKTGKTYCSLLISKCWGMSLPSLVAM